MSKMLGVYGHTVQFYNLTDEAPTYGNQNFTYMFDFMHDTASWRETIYHPETVYWVVSNSMYIIHCRINNYTRIMI